MRSVGWLVLATCALLVAGQLTIVPKDGTALNGDQPSIVFTADRPLSLCSSCSLTFTKQGPVTATLQSPSSSWSTSSFKRILTVPFPTSDGRAGWGNAWTITGPSGWVSDLSSGSSYPAITINYFGQGPSIIEYAPPPGATNLPSPVQTIRIAYSEDLKFGGSETAQITMVESVNPSLKTYTYGREDSRVTIQGSVVYIDLPAAPIPMWTVTISDGYFTSAPTGLQAGGNVFAPLSFSTTALALPRISALSPAGSSVSTSTSSFLVSLDQAIQLSTGAVTFKDESNQKTYNVASSSVSVSGNSGVKIVSPVSLQSGRGYRIDIPGDLIKNAGGLFAKPASLTFVTSGGSAPAPSSVSPAHKSFVSASSTSTFTFTFPEYLKARPSKAYIHNLSNPIGGPLLTAVVTTGVPSLTASYQLPETLAAGKRYGVTVSGSFQYYNLQKFTITQPDLFFYTSGGNGPSVTSLTPANGALNIPLATPEARVSFSEVVYLNSGVNAMLTTLNDGNTLTIAASSLTVVSKNVLVVPFGTQLKPGQAISLNVTGTVRNDVGISNADFPWSFVTEGAQPPSVASYSPANGATKVSESTTVLKVTFSEAVVEAGQVVYNVVTQNLNGQNSSVAYSSATSMSIQGSTVLFTIAAVGKFNVVTVTVPSGALKAYSGLAVPQFSWSFATEVEETCSFTGPSIRLGSAAASSDVVLPNNAGGQVLSFEVTVLSNYAAQPYGLNGVELVDRVGAGSSTYQACASSTLGRTGNVFTVTCTVPPGAGANMGLRYNIALGTAPCIGVTTDNVSYPQPVIQGNTLRSPGKAVQSNYVATNTAGELMQFGGQYFGPTSSLMVFYGSPLFPKGYTCEVQSSNDTFVTCLTSPIGTAGAENLKFIVSARGQDSAIGTDRYSYPSAPTVSTVRGCASAKGAGTQGCPTQGGTLLLVTGTQFNLATSVTIDSTPCGNVQVSNSTSLTCVLPAGAGLDQNIVTSQQVGGFVVTSAPRQLVSFALPVITSITSTGCRLEGSNLVDCSRTDSPLLVITGSNFGGSGATVLIGGQTCLDLVHDPLAPHSRLQCRLPQGTGLGRGVVVFQKNGHINTAGISVSYEQCQPGFAAEGVNCTICAPGTYSQSPGQSVCRQCLIGQFAATNGSTRCDLCLPGFFQDKQGSTNCTKCPVGTFTDSSQQQGCKACEVGKYAQQEGQSRCLDCAPGTFSLGGPTCTPCPNGTANDDHGSGSCERCSPGEFGNTTGLTDCFECPPGKFSVSTTAGGTISGPTACLSCEAGKYSPKASAICIDCEPGKVTATEGLGVCERCPKGMYRSSTMSTCDNCSAGLYTDTDGASECKACIPGTYLGIAGGTVCTSCVAGLYQPSAGQSFCVACKAGTTSVSGRAECSDCSPGQYNAVPGAQCISCPPGTFMPNQRATNCTECAVGKYSTQPGSLACSDAPSGFYINFTGANTSGIPCPPGTESVDETGTATGSSTCSFCTPGKYSPNPGFGNCLDCPGNTFSLINGSSQCISCPPGSLVTCSSDEITTANNAWVSFNQVDGSVTPHRCPDGFCLPGNVCAGGRKPADDNLLCGECLDGYTEWGGQCVVCESTNWPLVFVFVVASFIIVYVLHLVSQRSSGLPKTFFYFIQTALFMLGPLSEWVAWLSLFNFEANNAANRCIAPIEPIDKMVLSALVPFVLIGEIWIIMFVSRITYGCRHGTFSAHPSRNAALDSGHVVASVQPFHYKPFMRTTVALLIFSYTQVATVVFSYLNCVTVNGQKVVFDQPSINCDSADYKNRLGLMYLLLIFIVILFPVMLFVFLYRRREDVKRELTILIRSKDMKRPAFTRRWGVLFEAYKPSAYWFESAAMLRRTLIIVLNWWLFEYQTQRYMAFTLLNLFIFLLHYTVHAFHDPIEDALETFSLFVLVVISLMLTVYEYPYSSDVEALLTLLVFIPFLVFIMAYVRKFYLKGKRVVKRAMGIRETPVASRQTTPAIGAPKPFPMTEMARTEARGGHMAPTGPVVAGVLVSSDISPVGSEHEADPLSKSRGLDTSVGQTLPHSSVYDAEEPGLQLSAGGSSQDRLLHGSDSPAVGGRKSVSYHKNSLSGHAEDFV